MRTDDAGARRHGAWAGLAAVTATYVAFLLHAQFGFLALVQQHVGGATAVRVVMAAMAGAGLAASFATGIALARFPSLRLVIAGLVASAVSAVASLACRGTASFAIAAALVGGSIGMLTVALAADLRTLVPGARFGLRIGAATGLAYLVSNLPPTFHGGPVVQAVVPAVACVLAALLMSREPGTSAGEDGEARALGADDARGLGFASLVLSFLALVWLDSAAFRIVQDTAELRGQTWGTSAQSTLQGIVHLAAALLAGWLVDRGLFRSLLLSTFALFVSAFALMQSGALPIALAGPLYAAGISVYSTALVLAPSLGPEGTGLVARRWRAAIIYGVGGWLGSTLGIGMATDLHRIPAPFTLAAGAVLALSALLAAPAGRALARVHAPALGLAAPIVAGLLAWPPRAADAGSAAERGRRVYVSEGCINCHSQYVRPRGADVAAWGPEREAIAEQNPPLIGNRRQGPDLLNVGNRRTAEWHRLHLMDPRAIAPASRMPSYAHLFADGTGRGDDLVAYLADLGADTAAARWAAIAERPVAQVGGSADLERGESLYLSTCAPCHGPDGRGRTSVAAVLARPLVDLTTPRLPLLPGAAPSEAAGIAVVARHGLPGSPMAGHEWLGDADAADIAAWVEELRDRARREPGAP